MAASSCAAAGISEKLIKKLIKKLIPTSICLICLGRGWIFSEVRSQCFFWYFLHGIEASSLHLQRSSYLLGSDFRDIYFLYQSFCLGVWFDLCHFDESLQIFANKPLVQAVRDGYRHFVVVCGQNVTWWWWREASMVMARKIWKSMSTNSFLFLWWNALQK